MYTAGGCIVLFLTYRIVSYSFRRHIVGIMIRQSKSSVINVDSCPTNTHKVTNEVRYDVLDHYSISCSVAEIHVRSANEAYMSKYVPRFSMRSDNAIILLPQHILY